MTKNNTYNSKHILGYDSLKDFGTTLILLNNSNYFLTAISLITTFITGYIYDSAQAVYFMLFLIALDFITGCWNAMKNKEFKSSKLQRILAPIILYPLILSISWQMAKHSSVYSFLPATTYALMIGTLSTSIFENLIKLRLISADILLIIKDKIKEKIK